MEVISMSPFQILSTIFGHTWYLIPLILMVSTFRTAWFKGKLGEFTVNRLLSSLPKSEYTLLKDVTLPTLNGTTQIDHIVVSKFGIFVVETKNMKGWIFGAANQKQWTQKVYHHKSKFQNPIHQNYKHIKTLESLLNCCESQLHSIVIFIGTGVFKTKVPANVMKVNQCLGYIKQFNQEVFTEDECEQMVEMLNITKLNRGVAINHKHRQHIRSVISKKESIKPSPVEHTLYKDNLNKTCPNCGAKMAIREAKQGKNRGKKFLGCSSFPKCRITEPLI